MSEPGAEIKDPEPGTEQEPVNEPETGDSVSAWKVGVAVMMAGIIVFVGFILLRLVLPTNWAFTVEATTEVVEVKLRPNTEARWLVDGAVVCLHDTQELQGDGVVKLRDNPCRGKKWNAWYSPEPEQVLRLNGGASATMQLRPQGGFAVSLRPSKGESLGGYSIVGGGDEVALESPVNLIWTEVPQQSLTLPFSGETTLGRAVSWFDTRVLQSGNVVVYTADESADKRKMIDEAELMLGDQVRLRAPEPERCWFETQRPWPELECPWLELRRALSEPRPPWPKGFVYVGAEDGEEIMRVVAFGRAGSIGIERFGESGYGFEPARIRALAADSAVAFWGSILAAYMTLILSLQPFVGDGNGEAEQPGNATDLLKRFNRWLRSRPK